MLEDIISDLLCNVLFGFEPLQFTQINVLYIRLVARENKFNFVILNFCCKSYPAIWGTNLGLRVEHHASIECNIKFPIITHW